jgi:hypothetical protein
MVFYVHTHIASNLFLITKSIVLNTNAKPKQDRAIDRYDIVLMVILKF